MNINDMISYLSATDQLDEFLGLKHDNIANCPECNSELLIYDNNILYCPKCKKLEEYKLNRKIDNKRLSLAQKLSIDNNN